MKHKLLSILLVFILLGVIESALNYDDTSDTDTTIVEGDNTEVTENTKETISEKASKDIMFHGYKPLIIANVYRRWL